MTTKLTTDKCEHRSLEARVVRRHERRLLHRVQTVVPVAAAGLRRAVAALQRGGSEVAVQCGSSRLAVQCGSSKPRVAVTCSEVAARWRKV